MKEPTEKEIREEIAEQLNNEAHRIVMSGLSAKLAPHVALAVAIALQDQAGYIRTQRGIDVPE